MADDTTTLTYAQLDAQANRLAHLLQARGVGPDTLVGLCLPRTADLVVALLAVLKAGGAYVPLDPAYPAERLAFMLADAAPPLVLTTAALAPRLSAADPQRLLLLDAPRLLDGLPADAPSCAAGPDHLAYVIYTSGSTGRPKGAMITHRGLTNYLCWALGAYPAAGAGAPVHSSLSFDLTVTSLYLPLLRGGRVDLLPDEADAGALGQALLASGDYSLVKLTPAHFELVSQQVPPAQMAQATRAFIIGGETLRGESLALWQAHAPQTLLVNEYGPTETVVGCCVYTLAAGEPLRGAVPIGRPIANTRLYVLDRRQQPVPVGVVGELYIGGAGVARGYLNRAELTAERFVAEPFVRDAGALMYRTGDLVRYRADGVLECLGRTDDQVKIRGFRVELGEVEAALGASARVREAAVLARAAGGGALRLVAYVVPAGADEERAEHVPLAGRPLPGETADDYPPTPGQDAGRWSVVGGRSSPSGPEVRRSELVGQLRAELAARLPEYMVPAVYVVLEALPLTPNGKVDRRALPAPTGEEQAALAGTYLAPRNAVEEILAGIWADVLGVPRVGAHDDFFALGGHSLLAVRVLARAREALEVELPMRALFEHPTIVRLADAVEAARATTLPPTPPIAPVERNGELPLAFSQQRFWFLEQLEPGSPFYNNPAALRLRGALDLAAMAAALNAVVARHEALRTTFELSEGRPIQRIAPSLTLDLPLIELSALSPAAREAELSRLAVAEARRPFDLATGPLVRVSALRLAPDDHVLLLSIHHIVSDGWSVGVLSGELVAFYGEYAGGPPAELAPLPVQLADFAAWQRNWLQGEVLATRLRYWQEQLRGAPALLTLPTDRPRPPVQSFRGASLPVHLPAELSAELAELSRREGVTLFMTLLAGWQALLHRYSGQDELCVGTPIAGRMRGELEGLIGCFVNTLVLRADLSANPAFRDLLQQVRTTALDAYAHQELPFEMLVEVLQPERNLSHTPLFQVMFVLDNTRTPGTGGATLPGLAVEPVDAESGTARFDLTLALQEGPNGLQGALEYNSDLFDEATVARLGEHYRNLLAGAVVDPEQPVGSLELLSPAERRLLVEEWNRSAAPFADGQCAHWLFEARAAEAPAAPALYFEDEQISYGELNRRANQLAHHLRGLDVGPGVLVGIAIDRCPELVVAVLGVQKAGGAYVPLDPAYPAERLAFMLGDCGAPVLVTLDRLLPQLPMAAAAGRAVVCLDKAAAVIARASTADPERNTTADDLAYVIYTSGSTGKPKGALLQHRGLCNLVAVQERAFQVGPGKRVLQFSPFSFDASVWEMAMALCTGAALVLARQETLAAGPTLLRLLREARVTTATLPPSLLAVLNPEELPELETVIAAGERCSREIVAGWAPGRRFFNAYGPTETTVCASMARCAENDPADPTIGRPIGNFQLYVLDAQQQLAPLGVPGELHIGGVGLARGYLNRPELTAEKFSADPFSATPGARLYRTGDLVRYRGDGNLEFLGRVDHQIKLRGFRIELGEIEAALRAQPGVQDAVVLARADTPGNERLVGYLLAAESEAPPTGELRAYLRERLPEYMVPAAFVRLDAWPLSPSGKVDRAALPAPEAADHALTTAYVAPRSDDEATLAAICAELLGVERVGVDDDFFALGGHSLLATQLIWRVHEQLGVELPLRALFEGPTVAGLARALAQLRDAGATPAAPAIERRSREARRVRRTALAGEPAGSPEEQ